MMSAQQPLPGFWPGLLLDLHKRQWVEQQAWSRVKRKQAGVYT